MNSIDDILGMIATDSVEEGVGGRENESVYINDSYLHNKIGKKYENLPPINFDLELVEKEDGSYAWVE